jgi:hypothetical protein
LKARNNIRENRAPPRKPNQWQDQKEIRLKPPLSKNLIKDKAEYHQEETLQEETHQEKTKEEVKEETKEPIATGTDPQGSPPEDIPTESDQKDMSVDRESEYDPEEEKQTVNVTKRLPGAGKNSAAAPNSERRN